MFEKIQKLLHEFESSGQSTSDRQQQITAGAEFLSRRLTAGQSADAMFVCTHNSRRSQFAHVWAAVAASYFELDEIRCYSGGTEVTACNERTVASLKRFGFEIEKASNSSDQNYIDTSCANPSYLVHFSNDRPPIECSSKLYTTPGLQDFAAMMCCADVDDKCPLVQGAAARIAWHYEDPKVADDTDQESVRYDERSMQIGHDMVCLMAEVKRRLLSTE